MPTLTIELIRENPWNAVTHSLPPDPPSLLLEIALLAADYCRLSEHVLMVAALDGDYAPHGWEPGDDYPDAHEESEAQSFRAEWRVRKILSLLKQDRTGGGA